MIVYIENNLYRKPILIKILSRKYFLKKLSDKQKSAREKNLEKRYSNLQKDYSDLQQKFYKQHLLLIELQNSLKELKHINSLTSEESEEIKKSVKVISELQNSSMGKVINSLIKPICSKN